MPNIQSMADVLQAERSRILAERERMLKKIDHAIACIEAVEGKAGSEPSNEGENRYRDGPGSKTFWKRLFDSAVANNVDFDNGTALWRFATAAGFPDDPDNKRRFYSASYYYRKHHLKRAKR